MKSREILTTIRNAASFTNFHFGKLLDAVVLKDELKDLVATGTGKGEKGDPGETGATGATGDTGPAGAAGATGATGPAPWHRPVRSGQACPGQEEGTGGTGSPAGSRGYQPVLG